MVDIRARAALLYHFCRLRLPGLALPFDRFARHLDRIRERSLSKAGPTAMQDDATFYENLYPLDCFLACACLAGVPNAWETLFSSRANRTDVLLVDALRLRAVRLYPRDPERQEEAVLDFWGFLLAGEREGSDPILARYDGQRPLVPWLICVFQNKVLSELRRHKGEQTLPAEDLYEMELPLPQDSDQKWHEQFRELAREWFQELGDQEVLILGLRLRYKCSQREVASLLGIHEGNVSKRIDALSNRCHERIGRGLRELGWTGEDLYSFIRKEMLGLLLDEPRLAADRLAALLAARGKQLPESGSA